MDKEMGVLECTICGGRRESPTLKEAIDTLDHGVGIGRGRPCPNDGTNQLIWNGQPLDMKTLSLPGKAKKEPSVKKR